MNDDITKQVQLGTVLAVDSDGDGPCSRLFPNLSHWGRSLN